MFIMMSGMMFYLRKTRPETRSKALMKTRKQLSNGNGRQNLGKFHYNRKFRLLAFNAIRRIA